jgi:hypothetical protein
MKVNNQRHQVRIPPSALAPCGVNCLLCYGYQREKDKCVGCNNEGYKPYHCTVCRKKLCPEKGGDTMALCSTCPKFPCRSLRDLDKRYTEKYGVSVVANLKEAEAAGVDAWLEREAVKWTCPGCGRLLCVHRDVCLSCGGKNPYFP